MVDDTFGFFFFLEQLFPCNYVKQGSDEVMLLMISTYQNLEVKDKFGHKKKCSKDATIF